VQKTLLTRTLALAAALVCVCLALLAFALFNQDWNAPNPVGGTCSCAAGIAKHCSGSDSEYWGDTVTFGCDSSADPNQPVRAWVNCPPVAGGNTVSCNADFEGKADKAGVNCRDTGGDSPEQSYCG